MLICSIILGVLQIIAGIWMFSTPLTTFTSYGYLIIVLFFVTGIFGVVNAIQEKKYGNNFFFSILSLILGFLGMVIPGVAVMNNFIILYMIAGWLLFRALLSFVHAFRAWKYGLRGAQLVLLILIGILDLICAVIAIRNPVSLAFALGTLIGFCFIETGISTIVLGFALNKLKKLIDYPL